MTLAAAYIREATRDFVLDGSSAGELTLPAKNVRTSGIEIVGSTKGLTPQFMSEPYQQVVDWAAAGELTFNLVRVPLSEITDAWNRGDLAGSAWSSSPADLPPLARQGIPASRADCRKQAEARPDLNGLETMRVDERPVNRSSETMLETCASGARALIVEDLPGLPADTGVLAEAPAGLGA